MILKPNTITQDSFPQWVIARMWSKLNIVVTPSIIILSNWRMRTLYLVIKRKLRAKKPDNFVAHIVLFS